MFVKHTFIPDKHKVVLAQVMRQHLGITEPLLARLYKACVELLANNETEVPEVHISVFTSSSVRPNEKPYRIATATDERTGVYIQVASGAKGPLLTVGQRWAMEGFDEKTSTTGIKVW